jgi:sialate O-acetylesterase
MALTLGSIFGSSMVLQQSMPVPVWGAAKPGAAVEVAFAGQKVTGKADAAGAWSVKLAPLTASAKGAELKVSSGGESVTLTDVLVGEVWLCSGQSNMEWPLSKADNARAEIDASNHPLIRLFTVPKRPSSQVKKSLEAGKWVACAPETSHSFSAVGYFFGREVAKTLGVPVGLVNSSWGGTLAEAWTSREGLLGEAEGRDIVAKFEADLPVLTQRVEEHEKALADLALRTTDVKNEGVAKGWAAVSEPTSGVWKEMSIPSTWQGGGEDTHGIFWFRKAVDVPAAWAGKDLVLSIGATDKSDVTYFNGEQVGSVTMKDRPADSWCFHREYTVPGRLVKAGRNVIACRVHSDMYAGGMTGPEGVMRLTCPGVAGAAPIPLAGDWKYAIENNYGKVVPPAIPVGPEHHHAPARLHNGMIAPLAPFALRGVIWYQGESNAGRPKQYRSLFKALIKDWRKQFEHEALAFHFVQLANYQAAHPEPTESDWAKLREAQAMALELPHTGMAVIIDIGEADDIHPTNKKDVGARLAYGALHKTYGKKEIAPNGPVYRRHEIHGNAVRVHFDHAHQGLVAKGGGLTGFAVAGPDGRFHWAQARIEGESVVLTSDKVREPRAVRYAWANNPVCNLYNGAGIPASPFRTDVD